jgi:hypothetical protein
MADKPTPDPVWKIQKQWGITPKPSDQSQPTHHPDSPATQKHAVFRQGDFGSFFATFITLLTVGAGFVLGKHMLLAHICFAGAALSGGITAHIIAEYYGLGRWVKIGLVVAFVTVMFGIDRLSTETITPRVEISASLYPAGKVMAGYAGIDWNEKYVPIKLVITNSSPIAIESLDITVQMDTYIAATGKVAEFPAWSCRIPPESPQEFGITLQGSGESNTVLVTPSCINGSIMPSVRIISPKVIEKESAQIVLASVAINMPSKNGGLPPQLFAPKRDPLHIRVSGHYETGPGDGSRQFLISYEGPIEVVH